MTVTFFGHKNSPQSIQENAEAVIRDLIENHGAEIFYVGNQGRFDFYINKILSKISKEYTHIRYYTVLAYMPQKPNEYTDYEKTVFPESVASSHPKFAISKRNDWMLSKSDTVVAYVNHSSGGAAKYYEKAIRQKKKVINIADMTKSS
jgi:uncharacterized phage-like protein YoqJ